MKPREQGDVGELAAMSWLVMHGAKVFLPLGHSPDVDLVADWGDRLERVQVKTTRYRDKGRHWHVQLSTHGGNQSWSGLVKRFDPARCDRLFVLAADGRQWWLPAAAISATTAITIGCPKYAAYEVERGTPFSVTPGA